MTQLRFTLYTRTIIFISFLLFTEGFLLRNILPAVIGTTLLIFLVYAKKSFQEHLGEITVNRKIIEKQRFANHPLNIKTTLENHGGSLKIKAQDMLPENTILLKGDNKVEQTMKTGETISMEYQIQFSLRGKHSFNQLSLELEDKLGLFNLVTKKTDETSVMVHSDPGEIKKAKRMAAREHIEITMPSLIGAETLYEMEGIRNYQPGDKLRDIEWKATSRLQKLMTKLFQKKEVMDSIILLDCSRSMRRTIGDASKLEHATTLAIHLTEIFQSLNQPVGLIAYDEYKNIKTVKPTGNSQAIFRELTDLPGLISTNGQTNTTIYSGNTVGFEEHQPNVEHQLFISRVFPFLAKGKRRVSQPLQATGVYEATRMLLQPGKSSHLIFLTDLESNVQAHYGAISLAHTRKHKIWLLTMFSPLYNIDKSSVTSKQLEDMYRLHTKREKTLVQLKRLNVDIIELTPRLWAGKIIEKIRKKRA